MDIETYRSNPDSEWYFRISASSAKTVMLLSYHKPSMWAGLKFFTSIQDAMYFTEYMRFQSDHQFRSKDVDAK